LFRLPCDPLYFSVEPVHSALEFLPGTLLDLLPVFGRGSPAVLGA
jgi:hypothetical protein